jgi:hypothetical protein
MTFRWGKALEYTNVDKVMNAPYRRSVTDTFSGAGGALERAFQSGWPGAFALAPE